MIDLKKTLIPLFILFRITLFAQYIQDPLDIDRLGVYNIKIDSLQRAGLDTFFIYKPYCYTESYVECDKSDETYVFFKSKGEDFVAKYNECYKFKIQKVKASPSLSYFIQNFHQLVSQDSIRHATYIDKKGVKQEVGTEHSCYTTLYLSMVKYKYYWIDMLDFHSIIYKPSDYNTKRTNINYLHNEQTNIKQFINKISAESKSIKFTR